MGKLFLKISVLYFAAGVLLGFAMGILHDFRFTSVHAHINLLGWISMALFGLIYHFYPKAALTKLARTHFWLHNIGLPVMMAAISVQICTGYTALLPAAIIGSFLIVIGVLLFAVNLFKQMDN